MKKVLCMVLALSLAVLTSAAALADGLLSFDLEIVNDPPAQSEKPSAPKPPAPSGSGEATVSIPSVAAHTDNSGSGSSGSGGDAGSSGNSSGTPSDPNASAPGAQDPSTWTPDGQPPQDAGNPADAPTGGTEAVPDGQVPLGPDAQAAGTIDENVPQLNVGPAVDVSDIVAPLNEGIEEHEISDFELNGDAMHSLRIRASVAPGSVVSVGDRVELTAVPMGFMGVNFKIQWQMADVDKNGNMGAFHNIPGAFGAKYVIVFTEENIRNHWRAAIKIVD